jgi:hypothetical protein
MKTPAMVALLLLPACGGTLQSTLDARSTLPPPDALDCVMKAFETEGYKRTSYDKAEFRTTARKVNPNIQLSNVQFRKGYDVLEVDIGSGAEGTTELKVRASTVAELFSQQGTVLETKETSADAQEAARKIAQRCSA